MNLKKIISILSLLFPIVSFGQTTIITESLGENLTEFSGLQYLPNSHQIKSVNRLKYNSSTYIARSFTHLIQTDSSSFIYGSQNAIINSNGNVAYNLPQLNLYGPNFSIYNSNFSDQPLLFKLPNSRQFYYYQSAAINIDSVGNTIEFIPAKLYRLHNTTAKPVDSFAFISNYGVGMGFVRSNYGDSVWAIAKSNSSQSLHCYLISPQGISWTQQKSIPNFNVTQCLRGEYTFSANGKWGGVSFDVGSGDGFQSKTNLYKQFNGKSVFYLFGFNNTTGEISKGTVFYSQSGKHIGNATFTANSKRILLRTNQGTCIIDIPNTALKDSVNIDTLSNIADLGLLKLLPDGNVYSMSGHFAADSLYLGKIENPNQTNISLSNLNPRGLYTFAAKPFQRTLYLIEKSPIITKHYYCSIDSIVVSIKIIGFDSAIISWGDGIENTYINTDSVFYHRYKNEGSYPIHVTAKTPFEFAQNSDTLLLPQWQNIISSQDTFCSYSALSTHLSQFQNPHWEQPKALTKSQPIFQDYQIVSEFSTPQCVFTDSVVFHTIDWKIANLSDTTICSGDSVVYNPPIFAQWSWNDEPYSQQQKAIDISQSAQIQYKLGPCYYRDSLQITVTPLPQISWKQLDSTYCLQSKSIRFTAHTNSKNNVILWNQSYSGSTFLTQERESILLEIRDSLGCISRGEIHPYSICKPRIFIANAFTPNHFGPTANEVFYPVSNDLSITQWVIKNRWGQIIHNNPNEGWQGWINNEMAPEGIYFYNCEAVSAQDNKPIRFEGTFHLIR